MILQFALVIYHLSFLSVAKKMVGDCWLWFSQSSGEFWKPSPSHHHFQSIPKWWLHRWVYHMDSLESAMVSRETQGKLKGNHGARWHCAGCIMRKDLPVVGLEILRHVFHGGMQAGGDWNGYDYGIFNFLVGGLEHQFCFCFIDWEFHHPNWLSYFSEGWNHQPGTTMACSI